MKKFAAFALLYSVSCAGSDESPPGPVEVKTIPKAEYFVTADQTHNKFSGTIKPVLRKIPRRERTTARYVQSSPFGPVFSAMESMPQNESVVDANDPESLDTPTPAHPGR